MKGRLTEIQKGWRMSSSCEFSGKDEEEIKGFSKIYFKLPSLIFVRLTSRFIENSKLISNYHCSLEFNGLIRINFSSPTECWILDTMCPREMRISMDRKKRLPLGHKVKVHWVSL